MAIDVIFSGLVAGIVSVIINIVIYYMNKKQSENAKKLKEIDNQLLNLYLPMEKAIEEYKRTINASTFNPDVIDTNRSNLETALRDINSKNTGIIDSQVMQFSKEFFDSHSIPTLDKFLVAINYKITALKKERQKYQ